MRDPFAKWIEPKNDDEGNDIWQAVGLEVVQKSQHEGHLSSGVAQSICYRDCIASHRSKLSSGDFAINVTVENVIPGAGSTAADRTSQE